ncbi:hypothetical protein Tco_0832154 [Tanacetum coccineum]
MADDLHDLSSVEAEFPAIVINDAFAPQDTFQCKSQVSTPINDEFDFRISFDESDDEDYTIICDTNSFSYKMISVNNLKTDSENDYEKVMPSIPSPKPAISCFDDLDFFNDFENEFPAIVYNDAQTSKSDLLTEPILSPQHIDEFNDKTSLSEYDEEEQNVLLMFISFDACGGVLGNVASIGPGRVVIGWGNRVAATCCCGLSDGFAGGGAENHFQRALAPQSHPAGGAAWVVILNSGRSILEPCLSMSRGLRTSTLSGDQA